MYDFSIDAYLEEKVEKIIRCNQNVLLHGPGGTGKTAIINKLYSKYSQKYRIIKLASTGAAAQNIGGYTIHSIFHFKSEFQFPSNYDFKNDPYIKEANIIIIDEMSMMGSDVLQAVDENLKFIMKDNRPFGGKKMILSGDFLQLPPVVLPEIKIYYQKCFNGAFLFNCNAFKNGNFIRFELTKILRQQDEKFQNMLNAIRVGNVDQSLLNTFNERYIPVDYTNFQNNTLINDSIILCPKKYLVNYYNKTYLNTFNTQGDNFKAIIKGYYPPNLYPTEYNISLKIGARVMLIRNESEQRYVNGSIGKITGLGKDRIQVLVNNYDVELRKFQWENKVPKYDEINKREYFETVGTFYQFPCILCCCVTIHRVQGATFNSVLIDKGDGFFASGQLYVALSRCKSFDGLFLGKKLSFKDMIVDRQVLEFLKNSEYELL